MFTDSFLALKTKTTLYMQQQSFLPWKKKVGTF